MGPLCLGKPGDPGRSGKDNRLFVEAVPWIVRTGSPWRDLPPAFGRWSSVYTRFRDWVKADVWKRLFEAASDEPDMEYAMVTQPSSRSTATDRAQKGDSEPGHRSLQRRAHDQDPCAHRRVGQPRPLRSPARPALRRRWCGSPDPGHRIWRADRRQGVRRQLDHQRELNERGAKIVISQMPQRTAPLEIDRGIYKWRHLIENFFCKLKDYKRIALRSDKTDQSFTAMIHLAAAVINSR